MEKGVAKQQDNRQLAITSSNWLTSLPAIPVKSGTTPVEVLRLGTPALSALGKTGNEMTGVIAFRYMVADLVQYLGANWNPQQVAECGELAYDEGYWLSIAELKLFFTRVKTAWYKSHKNFGTAVFMEFLREFLGEMQYERGLFFSKQPAIERPEPKNPVPEEQVSAFLQDFAKQLMQQVREEKQRSAGESEKKVGITSARIRERLDHIAGEPQKESEQ